jgi:hypothetical protein
MSEQEIAMAIRHRSDLARAMSKSDRRKTEMSRGTEKSTAPSIIPARSSRANLRRKWSRFLSKNKSAVMHKVNPARVILSKITRNS